MDQIRLRPSVPDDLDLMWTIHRDVWRPLAIRIGTWNELLQAEMFKQQFDPSIRRVIQFNQCDAGFLDIIEGKDFIYLQNFAVSPAYQRRGIATFLLRNILADARAREFNVILCVMKENESARRLYERLGFHEAAEGKGIYIMKKENRE